MDSSNISAQSLSEECTDPDEVYNIPARRFQMLAQVIRHKNCMDVDDLLIIAWPGETSEKNLVGAQLLMLMYVERENIDGFNKVRGILLKTDKIYPQEGLTVNMAFYELKKLVDESKK